MGKIPFNAWMRIARSAWCLVVILAAVPYALAQSDAPAPTAPNSSSGDSFGSSFKRGMDSVGDALTPKPRNIPLDPADDPTSVQNPAKPRPDLYMAMARLQEQANRLDEAAAHYRRALEIAPNYLPALIGYASLQTRRGDLADATRLFERAWRLAPQDASILNSLGLCNAQRKMYRESIAALNAAIRLQPQSALYRNNLAIVLVDINQLDAAFQQLRALQPEAVAHYNLGSLLYKKGERDDAARQFWLAMKWDPGMEKARYWYDRANTSSTPNGQAFAGMTNAPPVYQPPVQLAQQQRAPVEASLPAAPRTLPPPPVDTPAPVASSNGPGSAVPPASPSPDRGPGVNDDAVGACLLAPEFAPQPTAAPTSPPTEPQAAGGPLGMRLSPPSNVSPAAAPAPFPPHIPTEVPAIPADSRWHTAPPAESEPGPAVFVPFPPVK